MPYCTIPEQQCILRVPLLIAERNDICILMLCDELSDDVLLGDSYPDAVIEAAEHEGRVYIYTSLIIARHATTRRRHIYYCEADSDDASIMQMMSWRYHNHIILGNHPPAASNIPSADMTDGQSAA